MPEFKTTLPNARLRPRFAGVPTFARFPLIELVEPSRRPLDWAVFGAPFDTGATYRPGARLGPRSIRDESQYVKPYHIVHDINIAEWLSMADAGDAPVRPFSCEDNARCIAEFATGLADPTTKLLMLGGDHSNTLAALRAAWARSGRPAGGLALLHFDSHVDTVDMTLGERYSHASPFIRAVEEGVLNPKKMLSVGVKGPLNTSDDLRYAQDHGVTLITYERWREEGTATIDGFLDALGDERAYLTFDIDCVDPAFAPGTGTPSVGGFSSAEALSLVRRLTRIDGGRGPNLVGADVVEVLPDRDVGGVTALLAAHVAFEVLALDARRKRLIESGKK